MDYDAIIAGAGPSGSIAALNLARAGRRVLLLEKKRLGRDKPCGGGLTPRAYHRLEVAIDDLVLARSATVALQLGAKQLATLKSPGESIWMVRRAEFDRRLAESAVAAGAELHEAEPVTAATQTADGVTVETAHGRYTAAALLLATGAEGNLRQTLGFSEPTMAMVGLELEVAVRAGLHGDVAVLDYSLPKGYAWAFPKGERWNVGVASADPKLGPQLRERLARFIAQNGIEFTDPSIGVQHAVGRRIPLWDRRATLARGRVALLGDAARLADPLFGEGIASALASGRLAAQVTLDLLVGRTADLSGYTALIRHELGPHLERTRFLAWLVYPMPGLWVRALGVIPFVRQFAVRVVAEDFRA
jgi:geranylgeranyl reductase family protein